MRSTGGKNERSPGKKLRKADDLKYTQELEWVYRMREEAMCVLLSNASSLA